MINKHINNITQPFFLLGGYDLEMLAIKNLLLTNGFQKKEDFLDNQLTWGAKLSAYQNDFPMDRPIYGIELIEDIPIPKHYHRIDHHNEWSHLPSAIEQVAELLNIDLSREEQLIAANDKAYIDGMKAIGATEDEISNIRQRDRAAQGVTAEDERLAEKSLNNLRKEHGITVVYALTNKFSAIVDRLYGKTNDQLLVYTDHELTYYGKGKDKLVEIFSNYIHRNKVYHGGGANGYLGVEKNTYKPSYLKQLKNQILAVLNS